MHVYKLTKWITEELIIEISVLKIPECSFSTAATPKSNPSYTHHLQVSMFQTFEVSEVV